MPEQGTVFRIFLPRHIPEKEEIVEVPVTNGAPPLAPEKPKAPDLTGHGTILLVEDEDGLRSLNARGLRSRGYTVIEAANGLEALEALSRSRARSTLSCPTW